MVTDEMVEKAARCIEPDAFAILDGGDQWRIINSHHKREATRTKARAALEAALSAAEPKPMPSVAVENLITQLHDAIDEYREGMKGDKFGPHEWPTVDGIKTTVAQALRRSALSAQLQDVAGWRPIETAPKDGTIIDLWHEEFGRQPDCYWGKPHHSCGEYGKYCDSDWHGAPEGWIDSACNSISPFQDECTHWMPLPAAPAKQEG